MIALLLLFPLAQCAPPDNPAAAKLPISPKPPRTYRTGIAFIVVIADERVAVIARTVLARTPLQPHFSSGPTHADIDTQGVVRAAM
jgi:hypothetical protein